MYEYTYRFHTSILFTNRQVYHEASDIFYMENLFIRVNMTSQGLSHQRETLKLWANHNDALSIRANVSKVQACTRHVMEIEVIPDPLVSSSQRRDHHFMLACDSLADFCREYLCMSEYMKIIIGDEVADPPENGKPGAFLNAATKSAAAHREDPTKNSRSVVETKAIIDEEANGRKTLVNGITGAKSRPSEPPGLTPRLRRLLEPLRVLHSIGFSCIDAPISEHYRQEIQSSLSRARPAIHDHYLKLLSTYDEALETFAAGCFASAIHKLRDTLDIYNEEIYVDSHNAFVRLGTGPLAGVLFKDDLRKMWHSLYTYLARAYLEFPKDVQCVRAAQTVARRNVTYLPGSFAQGAHGVAMAWYLRAEIWEALDGLGEHDGGPRSEALGEVIGFLMKALRHEPTNPTLRQELTRRLKEKAAAQTRDAEYWLCLFMALELVLIVLLLIYWGYIGYDPAKKAGLG